MILYLWLSPFEDKDCMFLLKKILNMRDPSEKPFLRQPITFMTECPTSILVSLGEI
jgi:hypothetical protein